MEESTESVENNKASPEEREARLERVKKLLDERGEDVAKLVRTWMKKDE